MEDSSFNLRISNLSQKPFRTTVIKFEKIIIQFELINIYFTINKITAILKLLKNN